jgi:tetratricopeptide (TPR) repeat protein
VQALRVFVAIARHRYAEAVAFCDRALDSPSAKSKPAVAAEFLILRASAHNFSGDDRSTRADLERAIALDKKNLLARNNYAWLLATSADATVRDGKRAIKFAREAIQGSNKANPIFLDTLAAAEAEAGDFTTAINDEKRAISLVNGDRAIYERHLQNYLNKTPCRESNESGQAEFKSRVTQKP